MEKYIEVVKQSIELSDTVLEGIQHIRKQLEEGKFEEAAFLFEDTIVAILTIERSVDPLVTQMSSNKISEIMVELKRILELLVGNFEDKNFSNVKEIMQFSLIPIFNQWKKELETNLKAFYTS